MGADGSPLSYNLFAYCLNNPVNMADDGGHFPFFVVAGLATALVGGIIGYATTGSWKGALTGAVVGGIAGLGGGAALAYALAGSAVASTGIVVLGGKLFVAGIGCTGYASFYAFKKEYGSAGAGKAWHHIVQQTAANISRFGAQVIHNAKNIVKISHGADTLHSKITAYYNSIQSFTGGMRVYEWLQTKSFQYQYNFGLETLQRIAKEIGAVIEFVK